MATRGPYEFVLGIHPDRLDRHVTAWPPDKTAWIV